MLFYSVMNYAHVRVINEFIYYMLFLYYVVLDYTVRTIYVAYDVTESNIYPKLILYDAFCYCDVVFVQ
jgi:hypothetical protein